MKTFFIILLVILLIIMSGCKQLSLEEEFPNIEEKNISKPDTGYSTVTGKIINKEFDEPLTFSVVRLAEVFREGDSGAYVLNEAFSPGARTDMDGVFVFNNVEAREYVLVVGDVTSTYQIIKNKDGSAKIWNAPMNEITDMGVIEVNLEY
jgi:hypothetical protein